MLAFGGVIRAISAVIVAFVLQSSMIAAIDEPATQAADEFMAGITTQETEIMSKYMDNQYVNFLANIKADEKTAEKIRTSLLGNLTYEIEDAEEQGSLAVVKMTIKGNDFSKAMENYEEASYEYVTENLYDDTVTDKKALEKKCLEIYADQLAETAKKGKLKESTIYLPMKKDQHSVWSVMLTDEIMKELLGNIALPDGVIKEKGRETKQEEEQ